MIAPRFSYHLDLIRFSAAFIVLLSHYAYPRFTDGHFSVIRNYNLGSDAVVVFFVLSGFVISFAATEKDKTAGRFAFNRLTRLYSVAIPALLLTFICDKLGFLVEPNLYKAPFYIAPSLIEYWGHGLTFSTEWTGQEVRLGTNGPYWSLSYEAAYYILFIIIMFMRGFIRVLTLSIAVVVVGVKVLLLLPAWAMGVGLYFLLKRFNNHRLPSVLTVLLIVVPLLLYICCLWIKLPQFLYSLSYLIVGPDALNSFGFSNEFLWNALVGVLFTLHLLGGGLLMNNSKGVPRTHRVIKWLAGASFSVYLVHYPLLQVTKAVMPETGFIGLDYSILLAFTIAGCFIFAELFERPLYKYRNWLEKLIQPSRQSVL